MLVFSDKVLRECNGTELASLLSVANAHGVEAIEDKVMQNQEAIKAYIQKRGREESEEEEYTKKLEERFM